MADQICFLLTFSAVVWGQKLIAVESLPGSITYEASCNNVDGRPKCGAITAWRMMQASVGSIAVPNTELQQVQPIIGLHAVCRNGGSLAVSLSCPNSIALHIGGRRASTCHASVELACNTRCCLSVVCRQYRCRLAMVHLKSQTQGEGSKRREKPAVPNLPAPSTPSPVPIRCTGRRSFAGQGVTTLTKLLGQGPNGKIVDYASCEYAQPAQRRPLR